MPFWHGWRGTRGSGNGGRGITQVWPKHPVFSPTKAYSGRGKARLAVAVNKVGSEREFPESVLSTSYYRFQTDSV